MVKSLLCFLLIAGSLFACSNDDRTVSDPPFPEIYSVTAHAQGQCTPPPLPPDDDPIWEQIGELTGFYTDPEWRFSPSHLGRVYLEEQWPLV